MEQNMDKLKKKLIKAGAADILKETDDFGYKNYYGSGMCISSNGTLGWRPQTDVFETETDFVIILDLSYIEPKKMELIINDDCLVIRGLRKEHYDNKKRHFYKMEIDFGPFERIINIPVKIDKTKVNKRYEDGFYIIEIEKMKKEID